MTFFSSSGGSGLERGETTGDGGEGSAGGEETRAALLKVSGEEVEAPEG
jgi:hypothetical protein